MADVQETRAKDFIRFKNFAAWTFIVGAPVLLAMPPRKLDLHSFALTSAFAVSANHLYRQRNPAGRGILDETGVRVFAREDKEDGPANLFKQLPTERAAEVQAQLRAAKEASLTNQTELDKYKSATQFQDRSLPEKIWMGAETEGWKERRLREEQQALAEGKGYGDLIMEHIWDVWNWGKPEDKNDNNTDGKK
ncbi:uncharacterized protein TRUGW13939_04990 [Talaromyces rugulosus]|uniref:Uncharacterized protein n=1 Tax=Talaromyces rugulosus TaxID=121627 RepID=A0A7H8QV33_TALRU|nr:uncharacterized protein TRUGW13939_04990 [Talaromyces rugulosus]QKX57870.1 hypothetical protein TRUGW13939_04990 [Talaromyces rugulosus]